MPGSAHLFDVATETNSVFTGSECLQQKNISISNVDLYRDLVVGFKIARNEVQAFIGILGREYCQ